MKDRYIDKHGIDSLPQLEIASRNGVEVFVTTNKSLLKDKEELEEKFNLKIIMLDKNWKRTLISREKVKK